MANRQRLDKVLSNFGFGSRKEIKSAVKAGLVTIDGIIAKDSAAYVDPDENLIEMNGERLFYRKYIYLMMNKPDGVISATEDLTQETVIDLLDPEFYPFELFPVGRLDKDTEGLLLLTNDGKLAHDLLSPKKHVPKRYFAVIDGEVNEKDVAAFAKGVTLDDGYKTLPAQLEILVQGEESEIEIVIHEGKYHQIKRMFEARNKKVTFLKRLSMGPLVLDEDLELGEYRELTEEELESLKGN